MSKIKWLDENKVKFWVSDVEVEWAALNQIQNIISLPIIHGHMAVMPDVHMGKGATVGSVIPTKSAIIPAAVGVDIGCGMIATKTNLTASDLPDSLLSLRLLIESKIPVGFNDRNKMISFKDRNNHHLSDKINSLFNSFKDLQINRFFKDKVNNKMTNQMGTLGGGNHFIEICLDENNDVWLMLHSGSRGIGNIVGRTAISMAKDNVPSDFSFDKDLAWLNSGTKEFDAYIEAMLWSQDYAKLNRDSMMAILIETMKTQFPQMQTIGELINCHHNFSSLEEHFNEKIWITRKGAVSANKDQLGIIPGSMGTKSYIVKGKGNPDSYCSCSHGAGRRLSRGEAKKILTEDDILSQTSGVECRKDSGIIDELPGAYKNIDLVMEAQKDLVEKVQTLKQIMCIKG